MPQQKQNSAVFDDICSVPPVTGYRFLFTGFWFLFNNKNFSLYSLTFIVRLLIIYKVHFIT